MLPKKSSQAMVEEVQQDAGKAQKHELEDVSAFEENEALEAETERDRYILQRHGTLALIPKPTSDPEDPLNLPAWKVRTPICTPPQAVFRY
jgi:hypothetical protein